jgi:hypothetical protein
MERGSSGFQWIRRSAGWTPRDFTASSYEIWTSALCGPTCLRGRMLGILKDAGPAR